MDITPLDIRNQKFNTKTLGGLDPDEVQAFLNQVATSFENLLVERADLHKTINNEKQTVENYKQIESGMRDAILMMREAKEDIQIRAREKAEEIIAQAKTYAEREVDAIRNQASDLRAEVDRLKQMRVGYFTKLRNLMRTQEDLLNSLESDE